ncbi:MAG: putative toxin-antitoxin system toxin component, PIN family [Verrucomicrobiaceae bacterium]|nr:putative toxin-antitoxin system toxin component, PIN family [Verrucomicrobiaceae bacterium]
MMRVVLDTNVILQARASGHPYHLILREWMLGRFSWVVSTEILFEYQEVITERTGAARWTILERLLTLSPHVVRTTPEFHFGLIVDDPDDNKFADCAIAANADFIVTSDHHFDAMLGSGYKPQPITPEQFIERYLTPP